MSKLYDKLIKKGAEMSGFLHFILGLISLLILLGLLALCWHQNLLNMAEQRYKEDELRKGNRKPF